MSATKTAYEHIEVDSKGVPFISGTTMKVIELLVEKLAHGWSAEELHFQHPHLTLGQIYSALAYYADHQEAIEKDMERRLQIGSELQKEIAVPPIIERLKSKGLI
ncbi:MAG: DUF433 domain-containing protein [Nitrospirota bacterium]